MSNSTVFDFQVYNEVANTFVDDISVTATPEPASLTLLATGLIRVFGAVRRRRKASARDHSLVGRNMIPRVKLEYQLTRAIFMRLVGEYDVSETDDLRDETRTFYPLIVGGRLATASRIRSLHGDYLFSYHPTPGTVLFLGYGSEAVGLPDETQRFKWQPLRRRSDYFFVKYSYLLRM